MGHGEGHADTAKWRQAKRRAIRNAEGICQWPPCSLPLNPNAPPQTPEATEVDHIVELINGGDPYAASNLRALHRRCHIERHRQTQPTQPLTNSNAW